jgi:ribosomal protein L29
MAATKKITAKKAASIDMKNADELKAGILAAQSDLVEARQSHASRELANTERLKELRVLIAQLKTALNKLTKEARDTSAVSSVKEKA